MVKNLDSTYKKHVIGHKLEVRRKKDPKTGRFVKLPNGRRYQKSLSDFELSFIKSLRVTKELGEAHALKKDEKWFRELRKHFYVTAVGTINAFDFPEEINVFISLIFIVLINCFYPHPDSFVESEEEI